MPSVPHFIDPPSLVELSDAELRLRLQALRERRIHAARAYERFKLHAAEELSYELQRKVSKQADLLVKELARADTLLSKIEGRINKIAVLRLQSEDTSGAIRGADSAEGSTP